MIPAAVIDEYFARKLDSHLWLKKLSVQQVDDALAALRPQPWIWPGTRLHQKVSILLGIAYPGFGFWLEMGSGKTLVALTLLRYWWDIGVARRSLVFVTSDKAFLTWEKQISRFGIDVPCLALEGGSRQKWRALQEFGEGIVLLTRAGAVAMCSKYKAVPGKNKKGRNGRIKRHLALEQNRVSALAEWAGTIVWDESTKEGHHTSLAFKLAARLRKATPRRYALAGRPFGRDPTLMYTQYKLIDDGETLGETLGLFRTAFCTERAVPWDPRGRAMEYTFRKDRQADLSRMIQHRSITYTADECVDLPPVVPIVEEVSFPGEARAYYERVVRQLVEAQGNYRMAKNVFLRMRQVSSGFVGVRDDETGARAEIEFAENPKLERLIDILPELPEDRKAVVFYEFTWSGRRICEALRRELEDRPVWLWSGTKDPRGELRRFIADPRVRTAVIQNRVGAYSLDGLQEVASCTLFYESPVSGIDREQAERRLERDGQRHRVLRYDLVVRGSFDQRILDFHREGVDIVEAIVRDPARVLGGGSVRRGER